MGDEKWENPAFISLFSFHHSPLTTHHLPLTIYHLPLTTHKKWQKTKPQHPNKM